MYRHRWIVFRIAMAVILVVVQSTAPVLAGSGTWTLNSNGNWFTASNWQSNNIAGGSFGDVANLTNNITADRTVTLDSDVYLTTLNLSDNGAIGSVWTLSGSGRLYLGASSGSPTITTNTNTIIDARIQSWNSTGLVHNGNAALILTNANNSISGTITNASGIGLQFGAGGSTGNISSSGIVNSGTVYFNYAPGTVQSFSSTISGTGVVQLDSGTTAIYNNSSYSGETRINSGAVLRPDDFYGVSSNSNLVLMGGVLEGGYYSFNRSLGTGAGQVRWSGNGGFSSNGNSFVVYLNGNSNAVTWGATNFVQAGSQLLFGSPTSQGYVYFENALNLAAGSRTINVLDNTSTSNDRAWLDGVVSNGSLIKEGPGYLGLNNSLNAFTGATINAGTLAATDGNTLPTSSTLTIAGGLFESSGTFSRTLGTAAGTVRWTAGGGFSSNGSTFNIQLNGNTNAVTWGSGNFVPAGSPLAFGSPTAAGLVNFQNAIDLNGATRTIYVEDSTFTTNDSARLSGVLSNGGLQKTGTGLLELTNTNTYSGTTTIAGGALRAVDGTGLSATSNLNINGGVFETSATTFTRSLGTGGGAVQWTGDGGFSVQSGTLTIQLNGNNSAVTWGSGSFVPAGSQLMFGSNFAAGTFDFQNAVNLGAGVRTVNVVSGNFGASTARLNGELSNGGLTKIGGGTLILTAANTYTGGTTLDAGTLRLSGGDNRLATTGNVTVNAGTFDLTTTNQTVATLQLNSGTVTGSAVLSATGYELRSGSMNVIMAGSGGVLKTTTSSVSLNRVNTYTGPTEIHAGTLQLGGNAPAGAAGTLGNAISPVLLGHTSGTDNAALFISGSFAVGRDITVQAGNTGSITLGANGGGTPSYTGNILLNKNVTLSGSGTLTFGTGTISGVGAVSTSGTVVFTAPTTYSGGTTVNSGTLRLAAGNNTLLSGSDITVFGTLDLGANNQTAGTVQINGGTITGTGTLTASTFSLTSGTINAIIGGGTAVQKVTSSSTLILNGQNTYTGPTQINVGALQAIQGVGLPTASNLTLNGGVFESNGTFSRTIGTAAGQVQWTSSGGFAAFGGVFNIQLNGNTNAVTWGSAGFIPVGSSLLFGSSTANNLVDFQNGINLAGAARTINVTDASGSNDIARISGVISNGSLTKAGSGVLVLSGLNTYTGTTLISWGTLTAGADAPSGAAGAFGNSSSAILLGDTSFNAVANLYANGPYTVARDVTVQNNGGNTLRIGTDTSNVAPVFTGNITLNQFAYLNSGSGSLVRFQTGTISGGQDLYKSGAGVVELRSANTYTGVTYVNEGILRLAGGNNRIASATRIYVTSGTLDVSDTSQSIATLDLFGGSIIGIGSITPTSTNNVRYGRISAVLAGSTGVTMSNGSTLTMTGPSTYTGPTWNYAGTLRLLGNAPSGAAGTLGNATSNVLLGETSNSNSVYLYAGAPITVGRSITVQASTGYTELGADTFGVTANYTGNIVLNQTARFRSGSNGSVNFFSGTISGSGSMIVNSGLVVLKNANTFSGGTTVEGGTLSLTGGSNRLATAGNLTAYSGTINLNETNQTVATFNSQYGTTTGIGTLTASTHDLYGGTINVALAGAVGLTRNNDFTSLYLNRANTFSGVTTLNVGTTYLGTNAPSGAAGALGNSTSTVLFSNTTGSSSATLYANGSVVVGRNINVRSGSTGGAVIGSQGSGRSFYTGNIVLDRNVVLQSSDLLQFQGGSISGVGGVTINNGGIVALNSTNSYSGGTTLSNGTLRAVDGVGLPTSGNFRIDFGVLQSRGTFSRSLGTGAGQVNFAGSGAGLAAFGGPLVVRLNGNTNPVTLGSTGFTSYTLRLGSTTATDMVDFQNGINLNGNQLYVQTDDNSAFASDFAVLSGVLSNGALYKYGSGVLRLTGASTYTSGTFVDGGTLQLAGGDNRLATSSNVEVYNGTFDLTDTSQTLNQVSVYNNGGKIQGSGTLRGSTLALYAGTVDVALAGTGRILKYNSSTAVLRGPSSLTGATTIYDGALQADDGIGLSAASNLELAGGVFESRGTFDRAIGSGAGEVRWTANGGFSAQGGTFNINLNGGTAAVTWGAANFVASSSALRFGSSSTADSLVDFQNDLDLNGGTRTVTVIENYSSITDLTQISGTISNGGLLKNGDGTLRLTAANTFTGGTTVSQGTLQLVGGNNRLSPGGTITVGSGILDLTDTNQTAVGLTLSNGTINGTGTLTADVLDLRSGTVNVRLDGSGGLIKDNSSGTVTLNRANGYTGITQILNGMLQLNVDAPSGAVGALGNSTTAVLLGNTSGGNSAALFAAAGTTVGRNITVQAGSSGGATIGGNGTGATTFTGNIVLDKNVNLQTSSGNVTTFQTGVISGVGGVTTTNSGTVVLAGTNTYSGTTTITAGTLQAVDGVGLPTASSLVLNGGVFQSSGTFSRSFGSGTGALRWASGAQSGFAAQGATLNVQLNGGTGTLVWGSTTDFATTTLFMGSTTADALVDFRNGLDLNGTTRTINVADNTASTTDIAQFSGVISNSAISAAGLTKTGAGTLRLTAVNTFTGTTTVSDGTLILSGGDNRLSPAGTINVQRTLDLTNTNQTTTTLITNSNAVILGSGTLTAGTLTLQGGNIGVSLAGSATATMSSGTTILTGTNSYTGGTVLSSGTLQAAEGVGLPTAGNLVIVSGVLQTSGTFSRTLGYGSGQARFTGSGGFAAIDSGLNVRLNGGTSTVVWGMDNFMIGSSTITFGSTTATAQVDFQNGINLAGDVRTFMVNNNTATTADIAVVSGVISNGGLTKSGAGTLRFTGNNTYANGTLINGGILQAGHASALGTGLVSVASSGTLEVLSGFVLANSISINGGTLSVDTFSAPSWAVELNAGVLAVTGAYTQATGTNTAANMLTVNGNQSGFSTTLRLTGNAATSGVQAVVLGTTFDGRLEVSAGRTLNNTGDGTNLTTIGTYSIARGSAYLALNAGSTSAATVTGTGSLWSNQRDLFVGYGGSASMTISDLATVANRDGTIGELAGSSATVNVNTGASWNQSGTLLVGRHGGGTINLLSAAQLTSLAATLGSELTGRGTVSVSGVGSQWTNSQDLYVGGSGSGALSITSGGRVSTDYGYIGVSSGSTGAATVTGSGSQWTNTREFYVGFGDIGTLNVSAGGQVTNTVGWIGRNGSGIGAVTVTGSDTATSTPSQWSSSSFLVVGNAGSGVLNVADGGRVTNTDGFIGYYNGSNGAATVAGIGSLWSNSQGLYIGGSAADPGGIGSLTVAAGGIVTSTLITRVYASGTLNLQPNGTVAASVLQLQGGTMNYSGGTLQAPVVLNVGTSTINIIGSNVRLALTDITGVGALRKTGSGALVVSGASNTFSGGTTVAGGQLVLADGSVLTGVGSIVVNASGAIVGQSLIHGQITLAAESTSGAGDGGRLSPGTDGTSGEGVGKLSGESNVTFNAGSTFTFQFLGGLRTGDDPGLQSAYAGTEWDLLSTTGQLVLGSGTVRLRVESMADDGTLGLNGSGRSSRPFDKDATASDSFQWLFAHADGGLVYSGDIKDHFVIDGSQVSSVYGLPTTSDYFGSYWVSTSGNDLYLNYAAVPEPSSFVLTAVAAFGLMWQRRRRAKMLPMNAVGGSVDRSEGGA